MLYWSKLSWLFHIQWNVKELKILNIPYRPCIAITSVSTGTINQNTSPWPLHVTWSSSQHGDPRIVRLLTCYVSVPKASLQWTRQKWNHISWPTLEVTPYILGGTIVPRCLCCTLLVQAVSKPFEIRERTSLLSFDVRIIKESVDMFQSLLSYSSIKTTTIEYLPID